MLLGVLRMPIDYIGAPLSPMAQFVSRAREAADRIEADAATIAHLKEENKLLHAELREWHKLRDPSVLHLNLLYGQPARLTPEQLKHLLGSEHD